MYHAGLFTEDPSRPDIIEEGLDLYVEGDKQYHHKDQADLLILSASVPIVSSETSKFRELRIEPSSTSSSLPMTVLLE